MPTIPEILRAQANLIPNPCLPVGKLSPKRHRDLPKDMNQLQAFSSAFSQVPWLAYSPGTSPGLWQNSGPENGLARGSPVAVTWAFKGEAARCSVLLPSWLQSVESNCQTSGTSAVPQPGFLFTPSVGSKHTKGRCLHASSCGFLFLLRAQPRQLCGRLSLRTVSNLGSLWQKSLIPPNSRRLEPGP